MDAEAKLPHFERIARLHAAYARCIDSDALESWPDFFCDPCKYLVTTAENDAEGLAAGMIYANSRAMLRDRITALRNANIFERHRYRHIIGSPYLEHVEAKVAHAQTPFIVARIMHDGVTDLFATGVYRDVFEFADDATRIRSRTVVCDSSRIDTLLVIPL